MDYCAEPKKFRSKRFSPADSSLKLGKRMLKKRLLKKRVVDLKTGCWVWVGGCNSRTGSGIVYVGFDRSVYAHRAAAFVWLGVPIQKEDKVGNGRSGKKVVRKAECRNPACFNPEHLLVFDTFGDIAAAQKAGTVRGIPKGNWRNKITEAKAREIKEALLTSYRAKDPELPIDMAERLNVTIHQVRGVHRLHGWRRLWTPRELEFRAAALKRRAKP